MPASAAGSIPDPSDEDLKRYYDNHHGKFTQPEFRKIGILAITPDTLKDQLQITDADIKTAFEAKKDKLGAPEKRIIQQIFPTSPRRTPSLWKIQSAPTSAVAKEQGLSDADIDSARLPAPILPIRPSPKLSSRSSRTSTSEPVTGKLGNVVLLRDGGPARQHPNLEGAKAGIEKALVKERASSLHPRLA